MTHNNLIINANTANTIKSIHNSFIAYQWKDEAHVGQPLWMIWITSIPLRCFDPQNVKGPLLDPNTPPFHIIDPLFSENIGWTQREDWDCSGQVGRQNYCDANQKQASSPGIWSQSPPYMISPSSPLSLSTWFAIHSCVIILYCQITDLF